MSGEIRVSPLPTVILYAVYACLYACLYVCLYVCIRCNCMSDDRLLFSSPTCLSMDSSVHSSELSAAHHIIYKYLVHLTDIPLIDCREWHLLYSFLLSASWVWWTYCFVSLAIIGFNIHSNHSTLQCFISENNNQKIKIPKYNQHILPRQCEYPQHSSNCGLNLLSIIDFCFSLIAWSINGTQFWLYQDKIDTVWSKIKLLRISGLF